MKNYELLDMIGDANEDYVRAADGSHVIRPRFRWKALAACAACGLLVLGAYSLSPAARSGATLEGGAANGTRPAAPAEAPLGGPISQDAAPAAPEETRGPGGTLVQRPGLHSYLLVDQDRQITATAGQYKASNGTADSSSESAESGEAAGGQSPMNPAQDAPVPAPAEGGDVPVQDAADSYERLMRGMGVPDGRSGAVYPDWYGGAWLDGDQGELLAVAIVERDRTPELEAQIRDWAGGPVVFHSARYSQNHLYGLMDRIGQVFDELDCRVFLSYGVYESDNCIHLDFSDVPGDEVLAALAQLDPAGDAILIQVFTGRRNVLTGTEDVICDPGRGDPAPGGVTGPAVISLPPDAAETAMPAYTENGQNTQPAKTGEPLQPRAEPAPGAALPGCGLFDGAED